MPPPALSRSSALARSPAPSRAGGAGIALPEEGGFGRLCAWLRRTLFADEPDTKIDLSSMIDCVFILLIFFIVTTVFVEETGVQVAKPDAAASPSTVDDQTNVRIEIAADGKITLDGREIALADVAAGVKSGLENPETPVVIRASEKSRHGTFVAVWDAARRGGAQMMSFNTVN